MLQLTVSPLAATSGQDTRQRMAKACLKQEERRGDIGQKPASTSHEAPTLSTQRGEEAQSG